MLVVKEISMKKFLSVVFTVLLLQVQALAVVIPDSTPVIVQPMQLVDADDYKLGDQVKFTVLQPVKINGDVVIKSGTEVLAQTTKKRNNFILGIPGEIEVGNFHIVTPSNEIIRLRGSIGDKGDGRYWAHIGWFFLFPILFVKGNDGKIPANTTLILYTVEEVNL